MLIEIKILDKEFYSKHDLPSYATSGSAGLDLLCTEDITLWPGQTAIVNTGISVCLGSREAAWDVAGLVVPRSSSGLKGLVLANTVGLIDADYQGEIKVAAHNRNKDLDIVISSGNRIAQLVIVPVIRARWLIVNEFSDETDRGDGGFGSTGIGRKL